jgi:hypothetical protein
MEKKTFAFKLADKSTKGAGKWKARDGVAVAGCTEVRFGNYRDTFNTSDDWNFC